MPNHRRAARSGARALLAGAAAVASLSATVAHAQVEGYYTYPDIAAGRIVFCAEDDLWIVPETGGQATRLTRGAGDEYMPRFSPDGTKIAFCAAYEGNYDVYTMDVAGGAPKRLTYFQYRDEPLAWAPDGKTIYYQTARETHMYQRRVWSVSIDGGPSTLVPAGIACYMDVAADGDHVVFNRNYTQPRTWKRYGGGLSEDLWYGSLQKQDFRKLTEYFGQDQTPQFIGDRIYFMSERDGRMNLWSMKAGGGDLKQHTKFDDFDIVHLSGDGQSKLVFQHGADLWLFDTTTNEAKKVPITVQTDLPGKRPMILGGGVDSYVPSDNGKHVAVTSRGDVFNVPVKAGHAIAITTNSLSRESNAEFAGKDDEWMVYISDKTGEMELYRRKARFADSEEQITKPGDGRNGKYLYGFIPAYASENVAFTDETGTLYWTNMTTKTLNIVDRSEYWEMGSYEWSKDANWLAYSKSEENGYSRVYIHDIRTGKSTPVTDPLFDSSSPSWDPDGKYLFFLSSRDFNPWNDRVDYETIMAPMTVPYGIALQKDGKNPFLSPDPYEEADAEKKKEEADKPKDAEGKGEDKPATGGSDDEEEDGDDEGDDEEEESMYAGGNAAYQPPPGMWPGRRRGGRGGAAAARPASGGEKVEEMKVDLDGIIDRTFAFPVSPQDLYGLTAVKNKIFYVSRPIRGRNEDSWGIGGPSRVTIKSIAFNDYEAEESEWAGGVGSYALSKNREHVAYMRGGTVFVTSASAGKASGEDDTINTGNMTIRVNPDDEWNQIVDEAYRLMRDFFYLESMAGTDWKGVVDRYKTLMPRLMTRGDLDDLLGHIVGELGHGHTYVYGPGGFGGGGGMRGTAGTGSLAASYVVDESAGLYKFGKIIRGERWGERAPLGREGVDVKEGDYILAVDGEPVTTDREFASYLWGKAGKDILLTVNADPSTSGSKTYRVVPVADDGGLYYRDWVLDRRRYTNEQSNGEIGYLHIPDMGGPGLVSFFRDWYPQLNKKALVIDVRSNGGGNVSQLLIQRLRRIVLWWDDMRHFKSSGTYPSRTYFGPMACLIDESAGSDGDIFPYMFRKSKLGPLIGTRTWGGVVGIRMDKRFVDGGMISIPEFTSWDLETGYDIENYGISPDPGFEVVMMPQDYVNGRDPQLDKAIEYLKEEMKKEKYRRPEAPKDKPVRNTEYFRKRSADFMNKP